MKKNCWEVLKCGREMNGTKAKELGICPVCLEGKLNGVHGGKNSGRACWIVAGSLCKGEVQGSFAQKYKDCIQCNFYKQVKKEEGTVFRLSPTLLKLLRSK